MSWNPFSRLSAPKKAVISITDERAFEKDVKKTEELDEVTRKLYKDAKRLVEANNAVSKSERKLSNDLLTSALCQGEDSLQHNVQEWDQVVCKLDLHTQELNSILLKTVIEPMKKFNSIFPNVQASIKKREQSLQEFQKCKVRVNKHLERERTGQNIVKLDQCKKSLALAKEDFTVQNSALAEDLPKLFESRLDYFQPCLEALIHSQVMHNTEAFRVYSELSSTLNELKEYTDEDYKSRMQQTLAEIKALSITVDD